MIELAKSMQKEKCNILFSSSCFIFCFLPVARIRFARQQGMAGVGGAKFSGGGQGGGVKRGNRWEAKQDGIGGSFGGKQNSSWSHQTNVAYGNKGGYVNGMLSNGIMTGAVPLDNPSIMYHTPNYGGYPPPPPPPALYQPTNVQQPSTQLQYGGGVVPPTMYYPAPVTHPSLTNHS